MCEGFLQLRQAGPLFIAVRGPLTIAASLVAEHRLQTRRLSSCGSRAQLLRGIWDPPRPGRKPASPALAGRFSTTAPPGKPPLLPLIGDNPQFEKHLRTWDPLRKCHPWRNEHLCTCAPVCACVTHTCSPKAVVSQICFEYLLNSQSPLG